MKITRAQALMYLDEARALNNGGWIAHSLAAGTAAERMAARIGDMDAERAFVLGVLHDIGRRFDGDEPCDSGLSLPSCGR